MKRHFLALTIFGILFCLNIPPANSQITGETCGKLISFLDKINLHQKAFVEMTSTFPDGNRHRVANILQQDALKSARAAEFLIAVMAVHLDCCQGNKEPHFFIKKGYDELKKRSRFSIELITKLMVHIDHQGMAVSANQYRNDLQELEIALEKMTF